jgi:pyridoxamine 5'-phosphate oxidase-like protein
MSPLPSAVENVLERGSFCYVATMTPTGPHVTPLVFTVSAGKLWFTTSRGSVKARAWSIDQRVAGLVRDGARAVAFTGLVRTYDVLDTQTWAASVLDAPALSSASLRFSRKNARFFAGYALDAGQVPLAWTPPGRVFVRVDLERGALIEGNDVLETWGRWRSADAASLETYRALGRGADPLAGLPGDVAGRLGRDGAEAALAVEGDAGLVVIPAGWAATDHELVASVPEAALQLAGVGAHERVALAADSASWWRARDMAGAMVQGVGRVYLPRHLSSGASSAAKRLRLSGGEPAGAALVRVEPSRVVWWLGWSTGTVIPP